ncbi:S24 family peptidase, partial [Pseudomonas sp. AL15]|uniref:S24 family peptidase n=1 Tax=Pseudomonas sp. AL15 TaxID=3042236 RepID=UPI00249C6699
LTFLDSLNLDSTCLLPFTATDRSMRGLIEEGDKVLIDRSITNALNRDDLFAILVGERIWIRWIRQDIEGQYKIQAEDRDKYPDDVVSAEKLKDLQILGRIKMISHIR